MALSEGYQRYLAAIGGDAGGLGYGVLAGGLAAAETNTPEARRKKAIEGLKSAGEISKYLPKGALDETAKAYAEMLGLPRTRTEKTGTRRVAKGAQTYIDPTKLGAEDRALYQQAGYTIPEQPQMGLVQVMDPEVRKRYEQAGMTLPGAPELKAQYAADLAARDPQAFQRLAQQPGGLAAMQLAAMPEQAKQMRVAQPMQLPGIVEEDVTREVPYFQLQSEADTKDKLARLRGALSSAPRQIFNAEKELNRLKAIKAGMDVASTPPDQRQALDRAIAEQEDFIIALDANKTLLEAGTDTTELPPIVRPRTGSFKVSSLKDRYTQALIAQSEASVKNAAAALGLKGQQVAISASRALTAREALQLALGKRMDTQEWRNYLADDRFIMAERSLENAAENEAERAVRANPAFGKLASDLAALDPEAAASLNEQIETFRTAKYNEAVARGIATLRKLPRTVYAEGPATAQRGGRRAVPAGPRTAQNGSLPVLRFPALTQD